MERLTLGTNGFPRLTLTHPSGSRAEVYLHGAQVTTWTDGTGRELLFLSRQAWFSSGRSIRGGIPVVFPQFASDGPLPKHGLLRTRQWSVARQDVSSAMLTFHDDEATRALWPHAFLAELTVTLSESLTLALTITNTDASPFDFVAALHSFFAVEAIGAARVVGLSGCSYRDKVRDGLKVVDDAPAVRIAGETDRVYHHGPAVVRLAGIGAGRELEITTEGFGDWVLWNPWAALTATFADMEPEDYRRMLCVEAARIAEPVRLGAGERWTGVKVMRVKDGVP